jgi:putative transposase
VYPENPHRGTILIARPNEVWASDRTLTATAEEGQVTVFVAVDHCTTECVGLHAANKATRFEALKPLRQAVRDYCGGFHAEAAMGIRNQHGHGSQYMSDDYQTEIAFLSMASSPSFVRQPDCKGCVERFIRTLKEQLRWGAHVSERGRVASRWRNFVNATTSVGSSSAWATSRQPRLASSSLHSEPLHEYA